MYLKERLKVKKQADHASLDGLEDVNDQDVREEATEITSHVQNEDNGPFSKVIVNLTRIYHQ